MSVIGNSGAISLGYQMPFRFMACVTFLQAQVPRDMKIILGVPRWQKGCRRQSGWLICVGMTDTISVFVLPLSLNKFFFETVILTKRATVWTIPQSTTINGAQSAKSHLRFPRIWVPRTTYNLKQIRECHSDEHVDSGLPGYAAVYTHPLFCALVAFLKKWALQKKA